MNRVELRWLALASAAILGAGLATPVGAQTQVQVQDSGDMQRAVARISHMDGDVSVKRGDSGDWVAGIINAPLMADDRIAAGPNSRAEVELDSSDVLYMGGTSEIHLAALEYGRYQMELAHGTITYRILRPSNANVEVDTPSVSVRPAKVGTYRITVNDNGETEVTARAGDVEVYTPRGSQWVNAGQMMLARGSASDPEFQIASANPPDDWDRWCDSRDRAITQSQSAQYVPQGVYGAEDMDNNGTWMDYPDYGYVWRPSVGVGWAPYQNGRWVWVDWYGWTWVSYDSWGWAPFHYGRWFWAANYGWCWYPGVLGVRHFWSPGLVAFFGFGGGGWGLGFGFGNVGWVALAPYEVFHPWWGRGFYGAGGFNRGYVNVANVNVVNVYRNSRVMNGVTAVSTADFRAGRFNNFARPGMEQLRTAGVMHGAMPISPSSANLSYARRQAGYVPRGNTSQHFFTHQQAPAVQHSAMFSQQRANNMAAGRAMGGGSRMGSAGQSFNRPQAGGAADPAGGGWRRFGQSGATPGGGFRGETPGAGSGVSRFGEPGGAPRGSYSGPNNAPRYNAPPARNDRPSYGGGQGYSQPRYNAPAQPRYNSPAQPRYSAPAQPRYSAPEQPRYSAPAPSRGSGGGGGGSRSSGGGHSGSRGRR